QQQQQQQQPNEPSQLLSKLGSVAGGLIKLLIYLILAGILGVYLWRNWEHFLRLWNQWFQRNVDPETNHSANNTTPPPQNPEPSFRSFRDPIEQGLSPAKIVVVTFQAFEAWSREGGVRRLQDETPAEFLKRFLQQHPEHQQAASQLVESYQRVVYGRQRALPPDVAAAQSLWKIMHSAN
ncbi:MAG: DUF4129 domain-containing protein, partial [Rubripirellula sp.]|nr:DUF4129 domain-containing protein [Rubripirellula sp.]